MVTLVNEISFFGFVNPVGNLAAFWKASLSGTRVVLSSPSRAMIATTASLQDWLGRSRRI